MNFKSWFTRKILRDKEARWNYKFSIGRWDGLKALDELARFSVIAGLLPFLKPGSHDILEYGCVDGLLYSRLHRESINYFEGVDISSSVIHIAQETYRSPSVKFLAANMDTYEPSQQFDVIIFNEVLCYSSDYKALLDRAAGFLKKDGFLITSLNGLLKDRVDYSIYIDQNFAVLDRTEVITSKTSFEITVFKVKV